MAFSMHSHSGQFCPGHAQDDLEAIILTAISKGMHTFALTEHMPRTAEDLYPEEIEAGHTVDLLRPRHEAFIQEAIHLRTKYASQIHLLIGFEAEWIRPSYSLLITELASNPAVDYFMGSVHHVHSIPIDYDRAFYEKARAKAGGSDERLFEDYFDSQFEMLETMKPKVVGHFDLIRLMSDEPNADLKSVKRVWEKVMRNLKFIAEYGGLVEINTSALRKGLKEPYPTRSVVEEYLGMGGKLTLSDDSHGIAHVGTNYRRAFEYLDSLGVQEMWTFEGKGEGVRSQVALKSVSLADVKSSFKE